MNNKYCFEALNKTLKDLRINFDKPFGGMTVILGGDFQQILLVIPSGIKEQIIKAIIINFYLWSHFRILILIQNMRLKNYNINEGKEKEIAEFSEWILNIGNGTIEGIKDDEN